MEKKYVQISSFALVQGYQVPDGTYTPAVSFHYRTKTGHKYQWRWYHVQPSFDPQVRPTVKVAYSEEFDGNDNAFTVQECPFVNGSFPALFEVITTPTA